MHSHLRLFLLQLITSIATAKYVYVEKYAFWDSAQTHCRTHYTDLAPIESEYDTSLLKQLAGDLIDYTWFGLLKNTSDPPTWMWSGGGKVTKFFWDQGQPQNMPHEIYGLLLNYHWHDAPPYLPSFFFCYSVHVVREEKTWEDALDHCRRHYTDLATITSETEMMLIQKELNKDVSTDHVWMGLHFLSEEWMWLDGHVMEYEAWGQGEKLECPKFNLRCGALVMNSGGEVKKWKAHDCQEELHFICY